MSKQKIKMIARIELRGEIDLLDPKYAGWGKDKMIESILDGWAEDPVKLIQANQLLGMNLRVDLVDDKEEEVEYVKH